MILYNRIYGCYKLIGWLAMLDLEGLRAICAVCDAGGFTTAGEMLNLTQSTISHQIRRLEERTGRRLLERTTRAVRLTVDGEMLLADARRILDLVAEAEARFSSEQARGEIRLGVPEEIACRALPGALVRFRSLQPGLRVAVTVGLSQALRTRVDQGSIDLAILKDVPAKRGTLAAGPLVWAGAKRLAQERVLRLAFFPEPCEYRCHVSQLLERMGRRYEIVMTSTSCESLRAAAKEELALVILPRAECSPEMRLDESVSELPKLPRSGYRMHPQEPRKKVVADLKDLIATYL